MTDTQVAADKAVGIHFTLKLDSGEVVDSSDGHEPMLYLHGHGNIVPGLESQLAGRRIGDKFAVSVSSDDGFGERAEPVLIPRGEFPDDVELDIGQGLELQSDDGEVVPAMIVAMDDEVVTVDVNHPLAGQNLHFEIEICSIRDATSEELQHGHIHGPGGHEGHEGHDH